MPVKIWYADNPARHVTYVRAETFTYPKDQLILFATDGDIVECLPLYRVKRVAGKKQPQIKIWYDGPKMRVEPVLPIVGENLWEEDIYGPDTEAGYPIGGLNYGDWSPSR